MNKIINKEHFSEKVFKLEIEAPLIARSRKAGHFVIVRVGEKGERMPLTIAGADLNKGTITLVVQEVGLSSTKLCNLEVGEFIHTLGDAHIYTNHFEQANLQLTRKPYPLPQLKLNKDIKNIFDFKYEDIEILNYQSHAVIKAPIAV